ncbi:MAG: hypothetical protein Q7J27_07890 [Syntrophales bacterium]|nr:hypothetical protein [Syntrophales bacterium]
MYNKRVSAPEDSKEWKCNWRKCAGGMGMAGRGSCSFRGEWWNEECPCFMTDKEFEENWEKETIKRREHSENTKED